MSRKKPKVQGTCGFCHQRENSEGAGKLCKTRDDKITAHYNCMLYSPRAVTRSPPNTSVLGGFDVESVTKEIERGRRLTELEMEANITDRRGLLLCTQESSTPKRRRLRQESSTPKHRCQSQQLVIQKSGYSLNYPLPDTSLPLKCHYCKLYGASIGCDEYKCGKSYHYECVKKDNGEYISEETKEIYRVFCAKHKLDGPGSCSTRSPVRAASGPLRQSSPATSESDENITLGQPFQEESTEPMEETAEAGEQNGNERDLGSSTDIGSDEALAILTPQKNLSNDGSIPGPSSGHSAVLLESNYSTPCKSQSTLSSSSDSSNSLLTPRSTTPKLTYVTSLGDSANCDVSSLHLSTDQKIELFIEYKKIQKQISSSGDGGFEAGPAKTFWNMCKEKNCLEDLLLQIKCTLKSVSHKILSGNAVDQDYEQAFAFLSGSRCLDRVVLEEKHAIQNKIQALEEEKQELGVAKTLLEHLLCQPQ
ncbi:PHD finger protein 11 isoform X2 [Ascaphus truei]|uniref:PHD finger protein 11 isoform X2 n=1 Tax=Ascaphus truei TaxID=8439 RepID=UPI003F5A3D2B